MSNAHRSPKKKMHHDIHCCNKEGGSVPKHESHVSHLILIEEGMRINSKILGQILGKSSEVICIS